MQPDGKLEAGCSGAQRVVGGLEGVGRGAHEWEKSLAIMYLNGTKRPLVAACSVK